MVKRCTVCGDERDISFFYWRSDQKGYRSNCKICTKRIGQSYYERNKERHLEVSRKYYLKTLYGLTVEEYDAMVVAQNGKCAICTRECPDGRALAVDHNHATGKVRGLLCRPCNTAIGQLQESLTVMRKATAYIEAHQ